MVTKRDDDYLNCKQYYNHIKEVSSKYPGFITFKHMENHFFAWVNDDKVILRSEAYPSHDKMERGIKAILRNRDIQERYSVDTKHGKHFLVLWGGGDHQKHTGNFDKHNEIGRSCPAKTKDELYGMMGFLGKDFVSGVFGIGTIAKGAGIAAATVAATKTTHAKAATTGHGAAARASAASSERGGFKWWYLLPLLLIPLLFMWKGCGGDTTKMVAPVKTELSAKEKADKAATLAAANEIRIKADEAARIKADADAASAKLAADAKVKASKGSGGSTGNGRNTNSVNFSGNKNSGF